MGKESASVKRLSLRKLYTVNQHQSFNIKDELSTQWNPCNSLPKPIENGRVLVTISTDKDSNTYVCGGFFQYGNPYYRLIKMLRMNKCIPAGAKVKTLLLDRGFIDIKIETWKELFSSGEKIMVVVSKMKTGIRKIEKLKEESADESTDSGKDPNSNNDHDCSKD